MKFTAAREALLKPLQAVIGVVERRQTMPILSNVLIIAKDGQLAVTATDLEVELVAQTEVDAESDGEITVSGRKLLDICRALPEGSEVHVSLSGEKLSVRAGRSKFNLVTLPAAEFPVVEDIKAGQTITVSQESLGRLIEKTHFSMAQQDVRYYLNGMLLETGGKQLRAVATDGHRLALCQADLDGDDLDEQQVIVPRKGVLELQRLMAGEGDLNIELGSNHIRIQLEGIRFTSKLIDGRFPEYDRVIPKESSNELKADRGEFKSALQRTAILSNEKYRGIRLVIRDSGVVLQAHNPEQEEAEEELAVEYAGEDIEIGFNVNYLLDALGAVEGDDVTLSVQDSNSSCLIRQPGNDDCSLCLCACRRDHKTVIRLFRATDFRCLDKAELLLGPRFNLISGANASGKTSLLEALAYLGRGKSFRGASTANLTQHGKESFVLFGELERAEGKINVGVRNGQEGMEVRVGGETASGAAALAEALPLQVIDPEVHNLIAGGPELRRRFLDWVAFHVEHDHLMIWRRFRRALKQRNAALKTKSSEATIRSWNAEFLALAGQLDESRREVLALTMDSLQEHGFGLLETDLAFVYQQGWSRDKSLAAALDGGIARDLQMGSTQVGPHRADIKISYDERQARKLVSRGQQKLLASSMILAATETAQAALEKPLLLLLDDPAAELDSDSMARLMAAVCALGCQVVATSLEPEALVFPEKPVMFHVEQGEVTALG